MDHQGLGQPQITGVVSGATQVGFDATLYQVNHHMGSSSSMGSAVTQSGGILASGQTAAFAASPAQLAQQQLAYQQIHQQQQQQLRQMLQIFWATQYQEVEQITDFKNHSLPLARIKKIMKADEDVRMIAAEVPIVFAKACEMFILELTIRSWNHTEENKRRTLQKNDIAAAITRTDIFDFLVDIVPREEITEEDVVSLLRGGASPLSVEGPTDSLPYYYVAHQQSNAPSFYAQHGQPLTNEQSWQQQQQQMSPQEVSPES